MSNRHIVTASNGLTVCAVSYPAVKSTSIRAITFTGSIFETPENNGISHLLEHMLFRGNQKLGSSAEVNLKVEELGGEINAATSFDTTEYWLDFHIDYLNTAIERFCQFLRYPRFEDLELEKSIILEEIRSDYNEDNVLIDLDTVTALRQWPNTSMGLPVIGREASVNGISRQNLYDWFKEFYQPGNMLIAVTGDFNAEEVAEKIISYFSDLPASTRKAYPPVTASNGLRDPLHLVYDNDNQFRLEWAFSQYPLTPRMRVIFQLLRRVLDDGSSSRLQKYIREEKGLVYEISADTFFFNSGVNFSIQSMVSRSRLSELMEVLVRLVQGLIKNGVRQEEFDLARRRYLVALDCNGDTSHGSLYEAIAPMIYPEAMSADGIIEMISDISLDELNNTIRHLFSKCENTFVLIGPWNKEDEMMMREQLSDWTTR